MDFPLIIASTPIVVSCTECFTPFDTEVVVDSFGSFLRSTICYYCNEHFQEMAAEIEMDSWRGI